ncbi:MAG: alpha/beta hydrolase, partial [Propionibacteriaceae bacterium]|nr:alpha/beta hydrolase [Propionibacteriaceae bacterium]
ELLDAVMAEAQRAGAGVAFEQWQFDQFGWTKARTNYSDQLHSITIPVLVVHADHDTGVPVNRARDAARSIPDARLLVVPDAGHWVQRDRPAVVIPAMLGFLAELT